MAIGTTAAVIIAGVVAAGSAAASYTQAKSQKDAQENYNEQLRDQAIVQYSELSKQEADVIEATYNESLQSQRKYLQARSSVELQAAASGTYGQSVDLALQDINTGFGQRMTNITKKRERELDNIDTQAENLRTSVANSTDYTIAQPAFYQAVSSGVSSFSKTYGTVSSVGETSELAEPVRTTTIT